MKKFYIIILLLISTFLFSNDIKIKIPDNYDDLKTAYLTIAKLYIEERNASIQYENELKKANIQLKELLEMTEKLNQSNKDITDKYEKLLKNKFSNVRFNILTALDYTVLKDLELAKLGNNKISVNGNLGFGVLLFNWTNISLYIRAPDLAFGLQVLININK